MTGPLPMPGDTALLLLADMLDKADEEHLKRREPRYSQAQFAHPCGTPACAIGHWLAAEGRRGPVGPVPTVDDYTRLLQVFEINLMDWALLFGSRVPVSTARDAAEHIRCFVRRRSPVKAVE